MSCTNTRSGVAAYCLMLLIMVFIGRVHELLPGMEKLNLGKLAVVLTVVSLLITPKREGVSILSIAPSRYVLTILVLSVLSIVFSVYTGGSVDFITGALLKNISFFVLVAALVATAADVDKITLAFVTSVLFLSVAVLLTTGGARASASNTYDSNDMAFVLVTSLPLVYYRMTGTSGCARLVLCGVIFCLLLACMMTLSRGGLLGLLVVGGAILMKRGNRRSFVPLLIASMLLTTFAPQSYWDRMSTILHPSSDYNTSDSSGRLEVWKRGLVLMATYPLGVGAGCFEVAEAKLHEGRGKWSSAHNSFVQIGAELGIAGLYAYVMLLLTSLRCIRESRGLDTGSTLPTGLLDGLEISFYGYITTGFFLSQAYSAVLYLLVAMTVATHRIVVSEWETPSCALVRQERAR